MTTLGKGRLEAFSDGVIAIIITIMVLELKAPHEASTAALRPLLPALFSYILSFVYVGIYWNNHHHLFHAAHGVTGMTLWANLHLLFWLSLVPLVTSWMGDSHFAPWPVVYYGAVLFACALAWSILRRSLLASHPSDSALVAALGRGRKERISIGLYIVGITLALVGGLTAGEDGMGWAGIAGCAAYATVAVVWFVPDRRIESAIARRPL